MKPQSFTLRIKAAVKEARVADPTKTGISPIEGTSYTVVVSSVRNRLGMCGGPAFSYRYSLVAPDGTAPINGVDRADTFVSSVNTWLGWRTLDIDSLTHYAAAGYVEAQKELNRRTE